MRRIAPVLFALAALATAPAGLGAWAQTRAATGATRAKTMLGGNTPTGSVSSHDVTVSWTASQFAEGATIPGSVVRRYDAVTNALQTVLAACAGIVGGTSCVEAGVPTGAWKYTVTPAAGNWRGAESAKSATVIVLV